MKTKSADILWHCNTCGELAYDGFVILSGPEMRKVTEAMIASDEFDKKHSIGGGMKAYSVADLMDLPQGGEWACYCGTHAEKMPDDGYYFSVSRILSYKDALDWTLHLMDKNWVEFTNWKSFIRARVTSELDS